MRGRSRGALWLFVYVSTQMLIDGGVFAQHNKDKGVVVERSGARKWALLVGVDDYSYVNDLKFCGQDVRGLKNRLVDAGFREEQIFLLHGHADETKHLPFKANIETSLKLLLGVLDEKGKQLKTPGLVGKGDLIVIAFSGHGVHLDGTSYLCPAEAQLQRTSSLISLERVYQQLSLCQADVKLLLVDACRNDPRPGGTKDLKATEGTKKLAASLQSPPQGILVLNSCAPGQVSVEDEKLGHGVFLNYVLDGLAGAADREEGNRNKRVSLLELYRYAGSNTKLHVARTRSILQTPTLRGNIVGDFEFGQNGVQPAAADGFTNSVGMKLALIPAGKFQMGSRVPAREMARRFDTLESHFADEHPLHQVQITRPFYFGTCEVTIGQFRKFVEAENYTTTAESENRGGGFGWDGRWRKSEKFSWKYAGWKTADDHPVANVSWDDAVAFCEWLSRKEGRAYRLPTEAEWEYACRAGSDSLFFHGDDPKDLVNFGNVPDADAKGQFRNWATVEARDGYVFSAPVGQFKPNAFGLHDMHGNVWEWCSDAYGEDYYNTFVPGIAVDPKGPASSNVNSRVLRGGSWANNPLLTRCAARMKYDRDDYLYNYGFRVVCELPPVKDRN